MHLVGFIIRISNSILVTFYKCFFFTFQNVFNVLTLRRLMSYTYGAPILDVSRSHTTTQHSR